MKINPRAGQLANATDLVDVPKLITAYYEDRPDPHVPEQRVAFGTSGHRGSSFERSFNEWHILAITQAICLYRAQQKTDGPLFLGIDTHPLSQPPRPARSRFSPPTGSMSCLRKTMSTRQPRPSLMPSSPTIAAARPAWPTALWSRPHTIPLNPAASSTTPPMAARPRPKPLPGFNPRPMSFW